MHSNINLKVAPGVQTTVQCFSVITVKLPMDSTYCCRRHPCRPRRVSGPANATAALITSGKLTPTSRTKSDRSCFNSAHITTQERLYNNETSRILHPHVWSHVMIDGSARPYGIHEISKVWRHNTQINLITKA
jgi:hypothetical protein